MLENISTNSNFISMKNIEAFKQVMDSSSTEFVIGVEKQNLDSKSIGQQLKNHLKRFLHVLFDIEEGDATVDQVFSNSKLFYNALNNIKLFLDSKIDCIPAKRIFNLQACRYVQIEEGFDSQDEISSDGDIDGLRKNTRKKRVFTLPPVPIQKQTNSNMDELIKLLEQRKKQVDELRERLHNREQTIEEMTSGFLKDIQLMRDMYERKADNPELEVYEVTYYDVKQVIEPEIKIFLEKQVRLATDNYRQRIKDNEWKIKVLTTEQEQFQRTIGALLAKVDLQQVVKTLFTLEPDKYKIWRAFQDCIGNEKLFQIFEKQNGGYGIDYRQIDEFISSSQASQRIFQRQKEVMEDQIIELVERVSSVVSGLQKDNDQQEKQIISLKDQLDYEITQAKRDTQQLMEQQFKEREVFLFKQFNQQKSHLLMEWVSMDHQELVYKSITRCALLKWSLHTKFLRIYPIFAQYTKQRESMVLTKLDYYEFKEVRGQILKQLLEPTKNIQQQDQSTILIQLDETLSELKFSQEQISEITLEKNSLQKHCIQMEVRILKNKHDRSMAQDTQKNMQNIIDQLENNFRLFDRCFQAILKRLGFRNEHYVGLKNLQGLLYQTAGPDLQDFVTKLQKLKIDDVSNLKALNNMYLKTQIAYNRIIEKPDYKESSTITDICNLNHPLDWIEGIIQDERKELKAEELFALKRKTINKNSPDQATITDSSDDLQDDENNDIVDLNQNAFLNKGSLKVQRRSSLQVQKIVEPVRRGSVKIAAPIKLNFQNRRASSIQNVVSQIQNITNPSQSGERSSLNGLSLIQNGPSALKNFRSKIPQQNLSPSPSSFKIKITIDQYTETDKEILEEIQPISLQQDSCALMKPMYHKSNSQKAPFLEQYEPTSSLSNYEPYNPLQESLLQDIIVKAVPLQDNRLIDNSILDNPISIFKTVRNIGTQMGRSHLQKSRSPSPSPKHESIFMIDNIGIQNSESRMHKYLNNKYAANNVKLIDMVAKENIKTLRQTELISINNPLSIYTDKKIRLKSLGHTLNSELNTIIEKEKRQNLSISQYTTSRQEHYQHQYKQHMRIPNLEEVSILRPKDLANSLTKNLNLTILSRGLISKLQ